MKNMSTTALEIQAEGLNSYAVPYFKKRRKYMSILRILILTGAVLCQLYPCVYEVYACKIYVTLH
jgi:hypothetical protein